MKLMHLPPRFIVLSCAFTFCMANAVASDDDADSHSAAGADLSQRAQDKLEQARSQQDYKDAAALYKDAVEANPKDYATRLTLGWVYLDKLHQPNQAYQYLNTVVEHSPNDVNARKLLGMACMQTGRNGKAAEQFRAASRLQPGDNWIQANLGRSLARLGDYSGAERIFDQVLRSDPNNVDARLGKAEVAAWRGHSETALEQLRALRTESPTNVEVLTLMGDIHRWKWKLSDAKQDYQAALAVDTNDITAKEGLEETKAIGSTQIGGNAYYFQDTAKFLRESAGGDVRVHLTDRAYFIGGGEEWRFNSPGIGNIFRTDGHAGVEYHWSRWLETSAEGDYFNYDNRDDFWGGQFSAKLTPMTGLDIYTVVAGQQPFVSSIATVKNGMKQDSVGNGVDWKIFGPLSFQNSFQIARLSDANTWWEEKPQLSLHVLKIPDTYIRVAYDHLSYLHANPLYWTPRNFDLITPILDINIPICKGLKIVLDGQAPYAAQAGQWGWIFNGGPEIELFHHVELSVSYYNSFIPQDQGAWSGQGGQASVTFQF